MEVLTWDCFVLLLQYNDVKIIFKHNLIKTEFLELNYFIIFSHKNCNISLKLQAEINSSWYMKNQVNYRTTTVFVSFNWFKTNYLYISLQNIIPQSLISAHLNRTNYDYKSSSLSHVCSSWIIIYTDLNRSLFSSLMKQVKKSYYS